MSTSDFLFTSESVAEGHPDKICDRISDTVLDAFLTANPAARVAVETLRSYLTNRLGATLPAAVAAARDQAERRFLRAAYHAVLRGLGHRESSGCKLAPDGRHQQALRSAEVAAPATSTRAIADTVPHMRTLILSLAVVACSSPAKPPVGTPAPSPGPVQTGIATPAATQPPQAAEAAAQTMTADTPTA